MGINKPGGKIGIVRIICNNGNIVEVPAPSAKSSQKYDFNKLEVGDYLEIPRPVGEGNLERHYKYKTLLNLRAHIAYYMRKGNQDKEFAIRYIKEENVYRIYRLI